MVMSEQEKEQREFLEVLYGPEGREGYVSSQLELDGLNGIVEDPNATYCAISLTATPEEMKPYVKGRQHLLKHILKTAGITPYDPATAPFSPRFIVWSRRNI